MRDRIREAFDQVHADEALKARTRAALADRRNAPRRILTGRLRLIPALACLMLVLLGGWGGYQVYFTPTSLISIDVNPSVELGVNRFDKVVSVEGFNQDGEALAAALDVKYMNYADALTSILGSDAFAAYADADAVVSIAVFGEDEGQCSEMLEQVETCTAGHRNTHCYADSMEQAEAAHEAGLSCGKYRAYLELKALDPSVTPDEVRDLSMREIRDRIAALTGETPSAQSQSAGGTDAGAHHGEGVGNGNGTGAGSGHGGGQGKGRHQGQQHGG